MQICTPTEAAQALADGTWTIVDVREAPELEVVQIAGALHVPLSEFVERFDEIPTTLPIALMCHHGGRSAQAQAFLATKGITRTLNIDGGIDRWAIDVDSSLNRY
ncbi:MAG: rhodanese-like domain-containing protein [Pseudomonadota bacterium]